MASHHDIAAGTDPQLPRRQQHRAVEQCIGSIDVDTRTKPSRDADRRRSGQTETTTRRKAVIDRIFAGHEAAGEGEIARGLQAAITGDAEATGCHQRNIAEPGERQLPLAQRKVACTELQPGTAGRSRCRRRATRQRNLISGKLNHAARRSCCNDRGTQRQRAEMRGETAF